MTESISNDSVLEQLDRVLEARKGTADPESSYVASLHAKGLNKILEKVGEEATETILAAKDLEGEAADNALRNELVSQSGNAVAPEFKLSRGS